ncbi:ATP-binding protein [Lysobacteraceae bacterium NML91-0213]|nr:ATP-binding protein [Xanthomonadaceae bacterium NML91-0213]
MTTKQRIPPRDRDGVLQALRAGVVPRRGLQYVQVGRAREVEALIKDIDRIADGGSGTRFVIGDFGAGKTFFLSLVRSVALEKGLVTMAADLNPDRRLYGSGGQARSLYNELTRNIATRTRPEGGAMASVVERFITTALQQSKASDQPVEAILQDRLHSLSELVGGYDFAQVIENYWRGHDQGNEQLKADAVRWLRGEFNTRTDARQALGVRTIIEDDQVYDGLKLLSRFVRLAGYGGLLICLDELVNLYKLPHATARNTNYEQILRILNDTLQGQAEGTGFVFGGTPETLLDARRGLYSYQALQSRLSENTFAAQQGLQDFGGPVIRLANLSPEDLYILLTKLRHVHAGGDADKHVLPDSALPAFLAHCNQRIGAAYFQTPRNTVRAFLDLLSVLEQHPELDWQSLIEDIEIGQEPNTELDEDEQAPSATPAADDELTSFRL